jgi:hypothetical protein
MFSYGLSPSGGGAYRHIQILPDTTWNISHNLGFYPSVVIIDEEDSVVMGQIVYVDENTINVFFNQQAIGFAYLN